MPHSTYSRDGKEWISWDAKDDAVVVWEGDETSEELMDAFYREQQARLQTQSDEECRRQAEKKRDNKARKPC